GLGIVNFNPQGQLNDTWFDLQPLGTEGQNIVNGTEDYPEPYSLWQFNVKLGVETTFYVQERLELDIWAHYTFLFTDYLDDVGGQYPNRTELLNAPEGELAAQFSFRDVDGGGRRAGSDRANPDNNDGFMNFGVSASYRITEARTNPRRRYRRFIPRARF
ncbi:MAG: hypothetical protein AAGB22_03560, partial [Bacteroidota bacterium]